jgi:hypothetical protein
MSLLSGTIPQIVQPYPGMNEGVKRYSPPVSVQLFSNPRPKVNTSTGVETFRNAQPRPGTKPTYGYVMPGRF